MTDVFISYSRNDKSFVKALKSRLEDADLDIWVDIDDLYAGEEFWPEVVKAIDAAVVFVFVISPCSASSKYCHKEAERASTSGKRIVPLCRAEASADLLHEDVANRQWVFLREGDDADSAVKSLLSAIRADWAELRQQARLLRRAREWQGKNKDVSLLLRGRDLQEAVDWRARNEGQEYGATPFHDAYIDTSRTAAKQRRNRVLASVVGIVVIITVISWLGLRYWIASVNNRSVIDIDAGNPGATITSLEQANRICGSLRRLINGCLDLALVLGHAYEQTANYKDSIAQYTNALELTEVKKTGDQGTLDLRGNAYQSRAFSRIMYAETLTNREQRYALYRLAEADIGLAIKSYEQTEAGIAGKPFVISHARIFIGYEQYDAAIERLELARRIDDSEPEINLQPEIDLLFAVTYHCLGNNTQSLMHFQKFAVGLGGNFRGPRWFRGKAYYDGVRQRCQTTDG
ncbi:MAG: toll/interleukin-1 receptor domain-containing protein [Gammaproteobacteria bacterium]|nr:toll/interleukin-1 receptor domain-containing protein [Gammaproteobacteria bacterium]